MENVKRKGNSPNFRGDGLSVWVNQTREGDQYLSVQILEKNRLKINCFKYEKGKYN